MHILLITESCQILFGKIMKSHPKQKGIASSYIPKTEIPTHVDGKSQFQPGT